MKEARKQDHQMTNTQRKSIVRECKKQKGWYNGEGAQDKLIENECISRGFEFSDFYFCEGKTLNKILST